MKLTLSVSFPRPSPRLGISTMGCLRLERQYHLVREADSLMYPRIRHRATPMRVPDFRKKYDGMKPGAPAAEEVVVRGRVQSTRSAGSKLVFVTFSSEFEQVQAMCNLRVLEAAGTSKDDFKTFFSALNRGDIISVTGRAIRTPAGELTIEATWLPELLSPSLWPLPIRLVDEETRMQDRHVDLLVNRSTADVFRLRSHLIKYLRDFFHERSFLEVQTPILAERAGGASARPFTTKCTELPHKDLTLRIAPELWLKRLVVGGFDKVFEIGPSFRNEGVDSTHNPEFTTCEFYDAYASLDDLMGRTEELLVGMAAHSRDLVATKLTSLSPFDASTYSPPFRRVEFIPALEAALGSQLPDLSSATALHDLVAMLEARRIDVPETSKRSLTILLDRLAGIYIECESAHGPLFMTHHPACMSPLAKSFACPATGQTVSARAELFVGGRELANMYEEENDPAAQRAKFGGGAAVDESYLRALESGLPPTGGWGCGVDRLVMLFSGAKRIADVLSFGTLRNVVCLSSARERR